MNAENLAQTHADSLVATSVSVGPVCELCLVDFPCTDTIGHIIFVIILEHYDKLSVSVP